MELSKVSLLLMAIDEGNTSNLTSKKLSEITCHNLDVRKDYEIRTRRINNGTIESIFDYSK